MQLIIALVHLGYRLVMQLLGLRGKGPACTLAGHAALWPSRFSPSFLLPASSFDPYPFTLDRFPQCAGCGGAALQLGGWGPGEGSGAPPSSRRPGPRALVCASLAWPRRP
jgi:hypothetical protein